MQILGLNVSIYVKFASNEEKERKREKKDIHGLNDFDTSQRLEARMRFSCRRSKQIYLAFFEAILGHLARLQAFAFVFSLPCGVAEARLIPGLLYFRILKRKRHGEERDRARARARVYRHV